jgi:hypothetical protein
MSRVPSLSSPFLLGFDEIERALDRVVKGADGYPPYNIERFDRSNGQPERLRITPSPYHDDGLIDQLAEALLQVWGRLGLPLRAKSLAAE